ncbi:hypothetical protein [Paenibacillus massiliensis]|uniref:hypothetical protein n=1 Tax=Paenibacillus massiliensis TaxID=225917 RepID=UPI0004719BDA|nr:hypothetical protein [Paenibacillus massiliensis]
MEKIVDEEMLDYDDLRIYDDELFTGIGYSNHPNGVIKGKLIIKMGFHMVFEKNGILMGKFNQNMN